MNPMELNKVMPLKRQIAYVFRGITFLPHYTLRGSFVAPGHSKSVPLIFHENHLVSVGAKAVKLKLWIRE